MTKFIQLIISLFFQFQLQKNFIIKNIHTKNNIITHLWLCCNYILLKSFCSNNKDIYFYLPKISFFTLSKIRFKLCIFFIAFFSLIIAQPNIQKIEILHADALKYNKKIDANRLLGNVVCKHENTYFYCDSAYLYPNQSLNAYGNIRIVSDSLNISANYLFYDATNRIASLEKNVICTDRQIRLQTEKLEYNTKSHIAYYPNKATITRQEHTLTSDKGFYYSDSKTLSFKSNVVLTNPDYTIKTDTLFYYTTTDIAHFNAPTIVLMKQDYLYCEKGWYDTKHKKGYFSKNPMIFSDNKKIYADSLFYDESKNIGYAFNHIRLLDPAENIIITGNYANYNMSSENAMITQHPILLKIHEQRDTIFLKSDTMFYAKKDSFAIAKCIHNAQLYHQQFQAIANDVVYSQKDFVIDLIGHPTFWFDKNQAISKHARLFLKNNTIEKIILDTNVIIIQEADTIYHNKFNQVGGRRMTMYFQNDSIKNILVEGNAQVYYFTQNEKHQWVGLNKAKCGKIRIDFANNEIEKIVFIDQPESILYPIKKIQVEKEKLPEFKWQPHLRPIKKSFL